MKKFVCIDIGGTSIKYGLLDEMGNIINTSNVETNALVDGGEGILDKIKIIISSYTKNNKIEGICISTAGIVDDINGEIIFALDKLIPNYTGMKLKKEIDRYFKIKCEVENDVNCAALGEYWLGSNKNSYSSFCLTIGTGIGGAFMIKDQVIRGFNGSAGEIGYMNINNDYFQDVASTTALIKKISSRKNIDPSSLNGKIIFDMIKNNDLICIEEIDNMINTLGIGISNICYMFNPEKIIIGGGIMSQEHFFRPKLEKVLDEIFINDTYKNTKIEFAKLKNNAGMVGSLYNFLQKNKN
ncbi:MAG: ROK family protein [Peptostreptococcaceae bacterium]